MSETPKQNDIVELRSILFETLRALSDKENPMDLDRAKTISDVSQTVINSAKVEIDGLRVIGGSGSGFIPALPPPKSQPVSGQTKPGVTVHKLRG